MQIKVPTLTEAGRQFIYFVSTGLISLSVMAEAPAKTLFNWNEGTGLPNWQWSDDVAFGNEGWTLLSDPTLGAGRNFYWGYGPRSFNKNDTSPHDTATIDFLMRAPTTKTGGSLKIYEKPGASTHSVGWWVWYDGIPLSERGITDSNTDRMSFYIKLEGVNLSDSGGADAIPDANYHVGTYLCWNDGRVVYGQGDGCPYEGIGNRHYYHYLSLNSGAWIHALLDQHPQHLRGDSVSGNNPVSSVGKNYFEQLSQFYMEAPFPRNVPVTQHIDEITFFDSSLSEEPNQNEDSISSVWVGYWSNTDHWEIGFNDMFNNNNRGNDTWTTFDIRWSTSPITNDNFDAANRINPLIYGGESHTGHPNLVRKINSWRRVVWTRFTLPNSAERSEAKLYFAIRDVSAVGMHAGSQWPWNNGDGSNAPTSNIKIIDYQLPVMPSRIKPPSNLRLQRIP